MKRFSDPYSLFLLFLFAACNNKEITPPPPVTKTLFDSIAVSKVVTPLVKEISGIADSKTVPHHLWAEEDSGNPPELYLISQEGIVKKKVFIKGVENRDWEDMARSGSDLFIAETGDNNKTYADYAFYKFPEPDEAVDTISQVETIRFQYPGGAQDAEAFLIDPETKDIFILTKSNPTAFIYKLSFPYSFTTMNTAIKAGSLKYNGVTSATLSPDGKEIIVKTYMNLYHYNRNGLSIDAALQTEPTLLPYEKEPQGEAISFAADNSGFYTLSEQGMSNTVKLFFYKRN